MSVVVPSSVAASTAARRRVVPTLCASLLALPLVALPAVGGTALAEAPSEPGADVAVVTTLAEPVVTEPLATVLADPEPVVSAPVATVLADPEPVATEPVPTVLPPAEPVATEPIATDAKAGAHDKGQTDNPQPVPDAVERPDLVVGLAGPATGWAGGQGAYTMSVANAATATAVAKGFTVVYTAPPGQTVLSVSAPNDSPWTCVLSDQASCSWVGGLAVGEAAPPVTVLVGHGRRAVGRLVGTAKADYLEGEVVLADNIATVVTAMEEPDLSLAVGAPDAVSAGEAISMVLSVTNVGRGWVSSFTLHGEVTDGVVVHAMSGAGFDCDVATLRCAYSGELAPGLSTAVTLTGVVAAAHAGGPLTTTAQIDQGLLLATAVTAVLPAARPAVGTPVTAAPPAAAAPARAVTPVRAVTPLAVRPATKPVSRVSTRALPLPQAVSDTRPATLAFADTPTTLPFTGSRSGSQLAGGVALLLLGAVATMGARRRTA